MSQYNALYYSVQGRCLPVSAHGRCSFWIKNTQSHNYYGKLPGGFCMLEHTCINIQAWSRKGMVDKNFIITWLCINIDSIGNKQLVADVAIVCNLALGKHPVTSYNLYFRNPWIPLGLEIPHNARMHVIIQLTLMISVMILWSSSVPEAMSSSTVSEQQEDKLDLRYIS